MADKCYGVAHQHKVSRVHAFEKDEALSFVHELMAEERGEEEEGEVHLTSHSQGLKPHEVPTINTVSILNVKLQLP